MKDMYVLIPVLQTPAKTIFIPAPEIIRKPAPAIIRQPAPSVPSVRVFSPVVSFEEVRLFLAWDPMFTLILFWLHTGVIYFRLLMSVWDPSILLTIYCYVKKVVSFFPLQRYCISMKNPFQYSPTIYLLFIFLPCLVSAFRSM